MKVFNKKIQSIILFFILALFVFGCSARKDVKDAKDNVRAGIEGMSIAYVANNPPNEIHIDESSTNDFKILMEVRNKGAYPQPGETGFGENSKIYISGFDPDIIELGPLDSSIDNKISNLALDGRSDLNPYGSLDVMAFQGKIHYDKMIVEKYEPILLATLCYNYNTVAGPSVCIDPDPYSITSEKKSCQIHYFNLDGQGGPVAVIGIQEEAFASKTSFKITVKNVGGGDVLRPSEETLEKCNPSKPGTGGAFEVSKSKVTLDDMNKIYVDEVSISGKNLECAPFMDSAGSTRASSGIMRLVNGEGFIICDLKKEQYGQTVAAYTTPLQIKLSYGYRTSTARKLLIIKEPS